MFEYFFVLGTIFLVLSGEIDEFRVNKAVTCAVLAVLMLLLALPDINIKYTAFINLAGVYITLIAAVMFIIMQNEHYATAMYGVTVGLLTWAVITAVPGLNLWYIKAVTFSVAGAMLCETYFQGSVISVIACIVCDIFSLLLTVDLELVSLPMFVGESKRVIVISLILPIIITAILDKRHKVIFAENVNEISG